MTSRQAIAFFFTEGRVARRWTLSCVATCVLLLGTSGSLAEELVEEGAEASNTRLEQARKGHVFTDDDLVFETIPGWEPFQQGPPRKETRPISLKAKFSTENLGRRFSHFYKAPEPLGPIKGSSYTLPVDDDKITNLEFVLDHTRISYYGRKKFLEQGFLSVEFGDHHDFIDAYGYIADLALSPLITSDAVLHLYQLHLSSTLQTLEENVLATDLENLTRAMVQAFEERLTNVFTEQLNREKSTATQGAVIEDEAAVIEALQDDLHREEELTFQAEVYGAGLAYFSVALALMDPAVNIHPHASSIVQQELALIRSRPGLQLSPTIGTDINYALFKPRSKDPRLSAYQNALTWYRNAPLSIGISAIDMSAIDRSAIATAEPKPDSRSRLQTILAVTLVGILGEIDVQTIIMLNGEPSLKKIKGYKAWERMGSIDSFFNGTVTTVRPVHLSMAMQKLFPQREFEPHQLDGTESFPLFLQELQASLPKTNQELGSAEFTLFGKTTLPEEAIFKELTYPAVDPRPRSRSLTAFHNEATDNYLRTLPRGLDLISTLGIQRAMDIIESENDSRYPNYLSQLSTLQGQFENFTIHDWHQNQYWSWMHVLKTLMTRDSALVATDPMPGFMGTSSWTDRQALTALSSWIGTHQTPTFLTRSDYRTDDDPAPKKGALVLATKRESLRRDEYEPYRQRADAIENKPSEGYVEPTVHTYAELAALTRMLHQALGTYGMLDTNTDRRLSDLTTQLETLQDISTRELNRQRLTDEDFEFIHSFAVNFSFAADATDASSRNITQLNQITSVPPDTQVLHEATGILRMLVLAHKNPGRGIQISVGPIYSYYEFKKAPEDSLSPEEWAKAIERGRQFNPPEWTESFFE